MICRKEEKDCNIREAWVGVAKSCILVDTCFVLL